MTHDEIREYAQIMELHCIEYLDAYGARAVYKRDIRSVRIQFVDGKLAILTRDEFSQLDNVRFTLRPARDNV